MELVKRSPPSTGITRLTSSRLNEGGQQGRRQQQRAPRYPRPERHPPRPHRAPALRRGPPPTHAPTPPRRARTERPRFAGASASKGGADGGPAAGGTSASRGPAA